MPIRITPSLAYDVSYNGPLPYESVLRGVPSPKLGTMVKADDGYDYIWTQASAAIAATGAPGTQVTVTPNTFTSAAGAGGFYAPVAGVTNGNFYWARRNTF